MSAALSLIAELQALLQGAALSNSPDVGVAEPAQLSDAPALVIALRDLLNPSKGLGEHRAVTSGALQASSVIDLADPVLEDPGGDVPLLDGARTQLLLLHGGLVDSEGSDTPLQAGDIQVDVDGSPLTLVSDSPGQDEFSVQPQAGVLSLGEALAATGTLTATYHVGQWERTEEQLNGILEIAVVAATNGAAVTVSEEVLTALAADAIGGMQELDLVEVEPVLALASVAGLRRRALRWRFAYRAITDQPLGGGVIERVYLLSSRDGQTPPEEEFIE